MLSPWIIHTFTFPPLLPLRYRALPFLTLRVGANFASASKPRDMTRSITHKPPYIFLKTATIPTYYGISIAIPSHLFRHFHILVGIFHYRTWLAYSNNGLPQMP